MNTIVCKDYNEMSAAAAKIVMQQIERKPDCVLGLATGSTPVGLYQELIRENKAGKADFSRVRTVNLDEYYPIRPDNDQSYRYFMDTNLFDHVNINKANTNVPDGTAQDPKEEGLRYEKVIADLGGIDLQVLGIGQNGHIAFNEPADELVAATHLTGLTESTIQANARFFASADDVPRTALTMGMGSILAARRIILLANGKNKHEALMHLFKETLTTQWPVSLLNVHKDVTVICDEEAYHG